MTANELKLLFVCLLTGFYTECVDLKCVV